MMERELELTSCSQKTGNDTFRKQLCSLEKYKGKRGYTSTELLKNNINFFLIIEEKAI